jgi:hypothetical protein
MDRHLAIEQQVERHYAQRDLENIILDALIATGKDIDGVAPSDLAPVDEFHTRGRDATRELAAQLIDITEDYVHTAEALARRVHLGDRVTFQRASGLAMPFEPERSTAPMMHVGMNIQDKPGLFAEIRRVLKRNAGFGVYDVMLTGSGPLRLPLPCALTPETCSSSASRTIGMGSRTPDSPSKASVIASKSLRSSSGRRWYALAKPAARPHSASTFC